MLKAVDDIHEALDNDWSEADVVYAVFGNLASKSFDDSTWGGTARQFANEIAVAPSSVTPLCRAPTASVSIAASRRSGRTYFCAT